MAKVPKSQLKELADLNIKVGASLNTIDITDPNRGDKLFEFRCEFTKSRSEPIVTGTGTGTTKKEAEHAACQEVLDLMKNPELNDVVMKNVSASASPTLPNGAKVIGSNVSALISMIPVNSGPLEFNPISAKSPLQPEQPLYNDGHTYVISSKSKSPRNPKAQPDPDATVIAADEAVEDPQSVLQEAIKGNKIGQLQEYCVKNKLGNPSYSDKEWAGPDNSKRYKVTCSIGDIRCYGIAQVKMNAKKIATLKVLQAIEHEENSLAETITALNVSKPKPLSLKASTPIETNKILKMTKTVTEKIVYFPDILIGKGGSAEVYEGYFEKPIRKAAVKISPKEVVHHEKNKELDIMRRINHPNIVSYFTTEDIGPLTYIVMELADRTLEDVIRSRDQIKPNLLKKFCTDATRGLLALHEARIVHRDLKPSNVLISGNVAKLADFGISKELELGSEGVVTEAFKGTRIWMPPEGLRAIGSPHPFVLVPSFDIFSLGLTIFYTMTKGKHLFAFAESDPPIQIQSNIVTNRANWDWVSANEFTSMNNLLRSLLSVIPNKRPPCPLLLEHPFFWDDKMSLEFVLSVSNDLKCKGEKLTSECRTEMSKMYQLFCNQQKFATPSWKSRLAPEIQAFIDYKIKLKAEKIGNPLTQKNYNEKSFLKLIGFIRDFDNHYDWDKFDDGKLKQEHLFGTNGSNYGPYFFKTFPELTTILYTLFQDLSFHGLKLQQYYRVNTERAFER